MSNEEEVVSARASVDDWEHYLLKHQFADFAKLRADVKSRLIIDYEVIMANRYHDLAMQVLREPWEAHRNAGRASYKIMEDHYYDYAQEVKYDYMSPDTQTEPIMHVGFKGIPILRQLSEINHEDIEKMIAVEDFVVSVDDPRPYMKEAVFRCQNPQCLELTRVDIRGYFEAAKMVKCPACNGPRIRLDRGSSRWDDFQEVKIQERQDKIEHGRIPMTKKCYLIGKDALNTLRPGDYARVDGTLKVFVDDPDYFLEVSSAEVKTDDSVLYEEKIDVSDEVIEGWVKDLGEEAFYQKLVRSIAPSVHGHELEKEALLLQMAGSDAYMKPDGTRHRGDITIGMWGSPRTAKSQLAQFIEQIYPRSEYVSGQVTSVGFTATLVHDKDRGIVRLEAGLYLLVSSEIGGVVIVDETEKTDKEARKVLAGVLDDRQMISIHKGPIHKDMRVHAASLFIANPNTGGQWNDNKDIYQNTGFEPWFLGRMDAQFIFRDVVDERRDQAIIRHYLSQFGQKRGAQKDQSIFSIQELRAWFMYVRKNKHNIMTPNTEPAELIEHTYMKLRKMSKELAAAFGGGDSEDEVAYQRVTMSDAGALIRFAIGRANSVLRNTLEKADVDRAKHIVEGSIASITFRGETTGTGYELTDEDRKLIKTIDIKASATKEYKEIEKKKHKQYRMFGKAVQKLGFTRCTICQGMGTIHEAHADNECPECDGNGGIINPLDISYIEGILRERAFSRTDISDIMTTFVRRGLITRGRDGRYRIANITDFEIASKELAPESDEDVLNKIPEEVLSDYEKKLKSKGI